MPRLLSRVAAQARILRGDVLRMELRGGARAWWFESPLAYVADETITAILSDHGRRSPVMEAGDSLFGWRLNSQTWLLTQSGEQ